MTKHIFKLIDNPDESETDLQGWIPHPLTFITEATSIHTGGGCMVDILKLKDGTTVGITDECVVAGLSVDELLDDCGDLPYIDLTGPLQTKPLITLWYSKSRDQFYAQGPNDEPWGYVQESDFQDYADAISHVNDLMFELKDCEFKYLEMN